MSISRREFVTSVTASGIALSMSRLAIAEEPSFAERETLPGRQGWNPAATGVGRIDGVAKAATSNLAHCDLVIARATVDSEHVVVRAAVVTASVTATTSGSHWTYTTVVADAPHPLDTMPNHESDELRWVAEEEVAELPLHPGFAASWRRLLELSRVTPLLQVPR